jgi:aspartate-semialdehyde dehydrogenase
MSTKFNIAIAGATGNVGREIIQILEDKEFPVDQLYLLASSRSKGQAIEFRGEELIVEDLAEFDFSKVQIGLFHLEVKYLQNLPLRRQKLVVLLLIIPHILECMIMYL